MAAWVQLACARAPAGVREPFHAVARRKPRAESTARLEAELSARIRGGSSSAGGRGQHVASGGGMAAMPDARSRHLGAADYNADVLKGSPSPAPKESPSPALRGPAAAGRDRALDQLYSIMTSLERKLGGGEGVEGIYGSITQKGTQRIFSSLHHNCGMGRDSVLVDVGAGLGRPLLHAMYNPGVKGGFGVELDDVKVHKAESFIRGTLTKMAGRALPPPPSLMAPGSASLAASPQPSPEVHCLRIEDMPTLEPATHAYSFWEGIPEAGRRAMGRLFARSRTMRGIAVVQRAIRGAGPAAMMLELGFGPLLLISNFAVSMSGSGASFQAYVFAKVAPHAGLDRLLSPAVGRAAAVPPAADASASTQSAAAAAEHNWPAATATAVAVAATATEGLLRRPGVPPLPLPCPAADRAAAPSPKKFSRRLREKAARSAAAEAVAAKDARQPAISQVYKPQRRRNVAAKAKALAAEGAGSREVSPRTRGSALPPAQVAS